MSNVSKLGAPVSPPVTGPARPAAPQPTAAAEAPHPTGWNPSSATRAKAVGGPTLAAPSTADLRLDVFDKNKSWQSFYTGPHSGDPNATSAPFAERVSQRVLISKGESELGPAGSIYTETKQVVKAPPEKMLSQLRDPHFWNNGSVDHWAAKPDGSFTYALFPAGHLAGVKVNETMHAPERLADGTYVVRIDLSRKGDGRQWLPGQAEGRAYIMIKPRPDGSSEVFGRFAGVRESNPLFNPEQFAKNHLLGERGELKAGDSFINKLLPNDTGFGAMLERAEQQSR